MIKINPLEHFFISGTLVEQVCEKKSAVPFRLTVSVFACQGLKTNAYPIVQHSGMKKFSRGIEKYQKGVSPAR